jgi:5'-nucleotidase
VEPLPLVLITNDDGITASGLFAAADAVASFAQPLIVAPALDQTGMGRAYARVDGVGSITEHTILVAGQPTKAYSVVGSPAETVAHAVLEIAERKPALCVAGINEGANVGLAIGVSGTIGGALEADSLGIPSLAISRESAADAGGSSEYVPREWAVERSLLVRFAQAVLIAGLPASTAVLNINLPPGVQSNTPMRRTRQSQQNVFEPIAPVREVRQNPHRLAIQRRIDLDRLDADDDVRAVLVDEVISYTLLRRSMSDDAGWPVMETTSKPR